MRRNWPMAMCLTMGAAGLVWILAAVWSLITPSEVPDDLMTAAASLYGAALLIVVALLAWHLMRGDGGGHD